jgi:hypothetical protein
MDPKVISPEGVYWINPAQDRKQWRDFVYTVTHFRVP